VHYNTESGYALRTLNILDKHSRECPAIRVKRKLNSTEAIAPMDQKPNTHQLLIPTTRVALLKRSVATP